MWRLRPTSFDSLAGWIEDDHAAALTAFARHNEKPADETYRTGTLGIDPNRLADLWQMAVGSAARADPRGFFEANFRPLRVVASDHGRGKLTGFYEPVAAVSRVRTEDFTVPLLRRPADLVAIGDGNRPKDFPDDVRFARRHDDGTLALYHDRAMIEAGALDGQGLEIAWLADPVEAFFIHIQGAARLEFADGGGTRVTYDGKTGHVFAHIGRLLVERGELTLAEATMHGIRYWLAASPERSRQLMAENRSYIFFRETPLGDPANGPIAAAKVPLTAHRSLAVDRLIHTFGTPVHVTADQVDGKPLARLMIAQETGSAIVGPARGDIFCGSGESAGHVAGAVNTACDFTVLVPAEQADELAEGTLG